jgi:hypothetical protein
MKFKNYLFAILIAGINSGYGQKNITKTNLLYGPFFKTYQLAQERQITKRISIQTVVKARPASSLSMPSQFNSVEVEGDEYNPFVNLTMSGIGNTTEIRFYGKDKEALRGFYWGPYFHFMQYKVKSPTMTASFEDDNGTDYYADIQQVVKLTTIGGGLQIGAQWIVAKRICIDYCILGIGYSQLGVKAGIEAINSSSNFDFRNYGIESSFGGDLPVDATYEVNKESVTVGIKAPWPIFKMGLSIGFAY